MHHQSEALHMCFVECCCTCQLTVLAAPPHLHQGLASNLKECMGASQCTCSSAKQPRRAKHSVWRMRLCTPHSMLQVLAGVTILFSALIPLGQDLKTHNLTQLGEQFGAKCVTQEHPSVTHVVTANSGSAKAQWALANGKHLVSRHWYAKNPLIHLLHAFCRKINCIAAGPLNLRILCQELSNYHDCMSGCFHWLLPRSAAIRGQHSVSHNWYERSPTIPLNDDFGCLLHKSFLRRCFPRQCVICECTAVP